MQTGIWHVLDGSSRGIRTASMPVDRAQVNQGVGKVRLENLGRHCREWPVGTTDSKINFLSNKDSKAQDLIVDTVGSVTKDQSGWGLTVKQGTTTIHKVSASYAVSNSSSLMEVDRGSHIMPSTGLVLPYEVTIRPHCMPSSSHAQ